MSQVGRSGNPDIDGILWGVKWDGLLIPYAFPTQKSQYSINIDIEGFQPFNAAQKAAARSIIAELNGFITVSVKPASDPTVASLTFAEADFVDVDGYGNPGSIDTAVGAPPDFLFIPTYAQGDMYFNHTDFNAPIKGAYDYITLIHELGHALGLKHGHVEQTSPDGFFTFPALPRARDSMEFSVMTYRSTVDGTVGGAYTNEEFGFAQSWMMNDIAALQFLYGADFTSYAGNTIYSWSPDTGEMFIDGIGQGQPGANRIFLTIWDGGGVDTYDMSSYATSVTIDLAPGGYSITAKEQLAILDADENIAARGNVFNALMYQNDQRSLIENAAGGRSADFITGNQAANTLHGNLGADRLTGLASSDTLNGSAGRDTLRGGNGRDTLIGGANPDKLIGGNGNDAFLYEDRRHGSDLILDFSSNAAGNNDRFEFVGADFGGLAAGAIAAPLFQSSTHDAAADAIVRFFFETDRGILRYDEDGSGTVHAAFVIATLQPGATVAVNDILIV